MQRQGFKVSADTVARILKSLGYSLKAPLKVQTIPIETLPKRS
ncbi:hypothetical protein [Ferrimicrobium sp.]